LLISEELALNVRPELAEDATADPSERYACTGLILRPKPRNLPANGMIDVVYSEGVASS
jgi:hypothetical protein